MVLNTTQQQQKHSTPKPLRNPQNNPNIKPYIFIFDIKFISVLKQKFAEMRNYVNFHDPSYLTSYLNVMLKNCNGNSNVFKNKLPFFQCPKQIMQSQSMQKKSLYFNTGEWHHMWVSRGTDFADAILEQLSKATNVDYGSLLVCYICHIWMITMCFSGV